MNGTQKKNEWNLLAILLVTVALTAAAWFGIRFLRKNSVTELEAQKHEEAQERSRLIPEGTSVDVTGVEVVNPNEDYSPVSSWLGTMEFAVTDAVLYESLEAFEASEESLSIDESGEAWYASNEGFELSILVVSLQATNKDARAIGASEDSDDYASLIDFGDFRVGVGNRVNGSALFSVDGAVGAANSSLWETVSLAQGETKQVKLAFFLIPKENYDSVIGSKDGDSREVSHLAAIYEGYVYGNDDELTLCLGWSRLGLESSPHVDTIPYVFELRL